MNNNNKKRTPSKKKNLFVRFIGTVQFLCTPQDDFVIWNAKNGIAKQRLVEKEIQMRLAFRVHMGIAMSLSIPFISLFFCSLIPKYLNLLQGKATGHKRIRLWVPYSFKPTKESYQQIKKNSDPNLWSDSCNKNRGWPTTDPTKWTVLKYAKLANVKF